jgi:hypothetical protein
MLFPVWQARETQVICRAEVIDMICV